MKKIILLIILVFAVSCSMQEQPPVLTSVQKDTVNTTISSGEQYIVCFELKEHHRGLQIGKHLKDKLNTVSFEISVDSLTYYKLQVGENFLDAKRKGSFWTEGSLSNWIMTVKSKRIKKVG